MLYHLNTEQRPITLPSLNGLALSETTDILLLSLMAKQSREEVRGRLANDNKAFVAYYNDMPAAFGWVAMGKARIGELNHEFVLPLYHRYLWNFRTLEGFRGLGIYPRLLQYIINHESPDAECFWILHAPENDASRSGIVKAGFNFVGNVNVLNSQTVTNADGDFLALVESIGFRPSLAEAATCWKCSNPKLNHQPTGCCCESKGKTCNGYLFASSEEALIGHS